MKTMPAMKLAALILFCSLGLLLAEETQVRVVRLNKPVKVEDSEKLVTNVIAFAESASVNLMNLDGDQAREQKRWQEVLASTSFIHLTFTSARNLRIMPPENQRWEEQPVSEILISLPEGRYQGIQVKSGTNYMALTKWQPLALKHLVTEPVLKLSTVAPYDHFFRLKESVK
jgi:hypothetical protein